MSWLIPIIIFFGIRMFMMRRFQQQSGFMNLAMPSLPWPFPVSILCRRSQSFRAASPRWDTPCKYLQKIGF